MNSTLFNFGPYEVNFWELLLIGIIVFVSILLKRIIHRSLKRYLRNQNIAVEGRRVTWLRLFSQLVFVLAGYFIILVLGINNPEVTFGEFLDTELIKSKKFTLTFSHILSIILIFIIAKVVLRSLQLIVGTRLRSRKDYDPGTEYVYMQIGKYVIYIIAVFLSLRVLFDDVSALLTGSIGIFLGIGLGLQDVFKDFFAGIVLLLEGNLKVGDIIEIHDIAGKDDMVAKIIKITVRTTQIETREGNVHIIPNTQLTQKSVENWSHGSELTRFLITVNVGYGSNIEEVSRLLKQAALSHPKVNKTTGIIVRLGDFGDSGLKMELYFWADQSWDINNTKSEIRIEIDRLFREYNVKIPFPQLDVHPL